MQLYLPTDAGSWKEVHNDKKQNSSWPERVLLKSNLRYYTKLGYAVIIRKIMNQYNDNLEVKRSYK